MDSNPRSARARRWARVGVAITLCAAAVSVSAATFVSFQAADLRVADSQTWVNEQGRLVDAAYAMGATRIRSDEPAAAQNGAPLLVGNNGTATYRTLLAFEVSYLTNLVAGNASRIDSAALVLTHDHAGVGGSSTHAVHLTLPFNEATATWNDPDGTGTNAGGFIGLALRERQNAGTSTMPTRATWGSPHGFWPDGGTGPDELVAAVRAALTNGHATLDVLVKRKSESANNYFSRFQDDGDADVNDRPELLVGVDSFATHPEPDLLAWYGFNENDNTAASLNQVAAATVPNSNQVVAANATAGSGVGPFGAGGGTLNTHGYGTGHYVSPPSGFYLRASATPASLAAAVAGDNYVGFTLEPKPGIALNVSGVAAQCKLQASSSNRATVVVRSSRDGFTADLASVTVAGNGNVATFTPLQAALDSPDFTQAVRPLEFRFYGFDDTDSTGDYLRLDDVAFRGTATNLPPGVQVVMLAASDPAATESGGDTGAFRLTRFGDATGFLRVFYVVSGTAANGEDYELLGGWADFAAGAGLVELPVIPLDDARPELEETVIVTLTPDAAYHLAGAVTAEVRIADDNDPPEFVVATSAPFAFEGGLGLEGVFAISRWLGDTNAGVEVGFELSGAASNGVDYVASETNWVRFEPGVVTRTITIAPRDDLEVEGNETVVLTLLPGAGYTVGATNSATATLIDDEGAANASLLVEAESFTELGGWVVDQQFVDLMGSPYVLAHGKGRPVADARHSTSFPAPGAYRLWVRTKDWTAPLPDHPGTFQVLVEGVEAGAVFGTVGQGWWWQDGGLVLIGQTTTELRLRDLTGFEGRCDALFFTTDLSFVPPHTLPELEAWRRAQLGLLDVPPSAGDFDLVVVGGGISGCSAAIAAARQGLQVALVHDRPYPGGNASRDVRVHTLGNDLGGITAEINTPDLLIGSDAFIQTDEQRLQVLRAETNLHLFTEWRAFRANTNGARITSVDAKHIRTGAERRFSAPVFIDSTGDGWIGYWAGALHRMGREARAEFNESLAPLDPDWMTMGTTLSWNSRNAGTPTSFPPVSWATPVSLDYYQTRGDWYWEYGLWRDTIYDAEEIRDHLFRAIYGTWWNVKQRAGNENLELDWVAHIGGKRESRRLTGDYILTEADVRNHPYFEDAVVTESRDIDIHFPREGLYDFLTYAQYTGISAYWIPFRCLYSTNLDNLMMAGRCLSATHVGLGSPRVMNTGGQMGVATGNAAALCQKYNTTPRGVYQHHIAELQRLIGLDAFFGTPDHTVTVLDNADTNHVAITGAWTSSTSNSGFYRADYLHDGNTGKGSKSVRFQPELPLSGRYRVYLRYTASSNRATNTPVEITAGDGIHWVMVDQTQGNSGWFLLGTFPFALGNAGSVVIGTAGTTGYVIADAVAWAADFDVEPGFTGHPWQDADEDGVCNYVEWLNGTDPLDPLSHVKVRLRTVGGDFLLRFVTLANQSYTIQYRESFTNGAWQTLRQIAASALTQEVEVFDPLPASGRTRFYRLVAPAVE